MIYYLIGVTGSGKDYFIDKAQELFPGLFGCVQVGKEFRRRYPPGHFNGLGAMQSTESEALAIFEEQFALAKKHKIVLICGQPRMINQINNTIGKYRGQVIWLHEDDITLEHRINQREPASRDLGIARLKNDRIQLYDVLFELKKQMFKIHTCTNKEAMIHSIARHTNGE